MSREIVIDNDVKIVLHDAGEALSDRIVRDRDFFERPILDYIRDNFPVHECIIDVGANVGNHTLYFAKYLLYNAIVAFEPIKDNFDLLSENVKGQQGIWIRNEAIGDSSRPIKMTINRGNMGACEVDPYGDIQVPQTTLDIIYVPTVTLLKIDVEWHEPEVLRGARGLLYDDKPLILIEDTQRRYQQYLPTEYRLLKEWPEENTYLYGWKDA